MKHAINPAAPVRPQLHAIGLDEHLGHKTTALYRFFAEDGSLLYVGVTRNPLARWQSHSRTAAWWPSVVMVAVEWHPYTNAATDAEYAAIKAEKPLFNLQGSPSSLTRSSELPHTLLMRNVPLSLSRSRRRSTRRSQGRSPHPSTDSSSHGGRRRSLPLSAPTMDDRCAVTR